MEELLRILSIGGDLGIWVLVAVVWRFDQRLIRLEVTMQSHIESDSRAHKSFDRRIDKIESRAA